MNFFLPNQINSAASWINWKDKLPTQFIMFNSHLSSFRLCSQVFVVTTCLSQMIAFFTAWTNPKTHQTSLHLPKNCICFCLEFPPLSGAIDKESAFCLITPIYFVSHSKTIYPCSRWIKATPISTYHFFSVNSRNVANLLFRTPPRQFHPFARNLAHSICGPSREIFIKRILMF